MSRVLEMLQRPRKSFTVEDFFPIEAGSLDSNCALLALFNAKPVSPESPLELPNFCGAKRISTSEFSPPSGKQTDQHAPRNGRYSWKVPFSGAQHAPADSPRTARRRQVKVTFSLSRHGGADWLTATVRPFPSGGGAIRVSPNGRDRKPHLLAHGPGQEPAHGARNSQLHWPA